MIILGNRILNSIFGQGMQQLLGDLILVLQIAGGSLVVIFFIAACIKKSKEDDEQGRKRYTGWQIALIFILVLIVAAKEILNLILSYFGFAIP